MAGVVGAIAAGDRGVAVDASDIVFAGEVTVGRTGAKDLTGCFGASLQVLASQQ